MVLDGNSYSPWMLYLYAEAELTYPCTLSYDIGVTHSLEHCSLWKVLCSFVIQRSFLRRMSSWPHNSMFHTPTEGTSQLVSSPQIVLEIS